MTSANQKLTLSRRDVEELTEAFHTFDLDKDGRITEVELIAVLKQLGFVFSPEDVRGMMRAADVDGNGSIDLDEFLQINAAANCLDSEDSTQLLKEVFEVFDKDKNGVISPEELREALMHLVPSEQPLSVDDCRQMIQRVDANGDGVVDFPEFQRMMTSSELLPCSG